MKKKTGRMIGLSLALVSMIAAGSISAAAEDMSEEAADIIQAASEMLDEISEEAAGAAQEGLEAAENAAEDVAAAADEGLEALNDAAEEAVEAVQAGLEALENAAEEAADAEQPEEDEENYETGDASLDDPRNGDEIGEDELLVISFGTSFNDSRRKTIGGIEGALEKAFPDWSIRRGFTSQIIIDHVKERDGEIIDNVTEALNRAADNGVKRLVVQPTHLMHGFEYTDLTGELAEFADAFEQITIGEPLLTSDEDFARVADIIAEETASYADGQTAIVFMGHGTEAESNGVYAQMQQVLADAGYADYYIGTVEAAPSVEDVLAAIQEKEYTRVVLEPLMIVAGDHANNDMAGEEDDSWKSIFENAGYEVEVVLRGLGEMEKIQEIFAEHAQAAIDSLE